MKKQFVYILFLSLFAVICGCGNGLETDKADLVLHNGKILTMDATRSEAEAIAVTGDTITAVGNDSDIEPYIGQKTTVIDLKGQLTVPGLIDGHGHYMSLGESLMGLDLRRHEHGMKSSTGLPKPSAMTSRASGSSAGDGIKTNGTIRRLQALKDCRCTRA